MTIRTAGARGVAVTALALATAACGADGVGGDDRRAAPSTVASLRVLAPASLTEAFAVIAERFEAANRRVEVELGFGGSSALVTQLAAGAPVDVLATADEDSMARAVEAGDVGEPVVFARNRLTVVVEPGNPLALAQADDLAREDVVVVVCAPAVPCGRLATRALDAAEVTVSPRSQEENVKAVLAKVTLGEADAGLVYETDARAAGAAVETLSLLPTDPVLTTSYPISVATGADAPEVAARFVTFVRSDEGQQVLRGHGFLPPG